MDLNTIWFVLVGVLIAGYGVLDGFDLGVGTLSLLARSPEERAAHIEAIAPFWDGNEVWLLTGGGAIFAAFPYVYATIFSGFYLALMLLLVALIARVVALEYRNVVQGEGARRFFDAAFGVGSLLPAVLFGVAVGNVLRGVPVTAEREWAGSFLGLLNPYAVVVGLVTLSLFTLHGALFLRLKTEGQLAARLDRWIPRLWLTFVILYALATFLTVFVSPFLFHGVVGNPLFIALAVLLVAAVVAVPLSARGGRHGLAFIASGATIVLMVLVAALSIFPRIVPSSLGLEHSLTVYNASSSPRTLATMLVIALVGVPIMLAYTIWAYCLFRGNIGAGEQAKGNRA